MLRLCIDIGNTRTKLAQFKENEIINSAAFVNTDLIDIIRFLETHEYSRSIISDVGGIPQPILQELNSKSLLHHFNSKTRLPISIQYETPETLGKDRIAALVGGASLSYNSDLFIVNLGTCITLDFLSRENEFKGGNISPGLKMRWKAMHEFTKALPLVDATQDTFGIFGHSTKDALILGVLNGVAYEIEGYYKELLTKYPNTLCVLTGGDTNLLVNRLNFKTFADPFLILKGLNHILDYQ